MANLKSKQAGDMDTGDDGAVGRKRPAWHTVARILVVLLLAELGLLAYAIGKLNSLGYFEHLPIVQKDRAGGGVNQPEGLEPAGDSDGGQEEDLNPAGEAGKTPIYAVEPIDPDVVNILVLGVDTWKPGGHGRADLNMIVSIDRKRKTIKLASLLRDTLVPIEGHDWNRLNTAFAFGGAGLAINTVNDAFGLDIQRYVRLDFFAIRDIIDTVGGVDIKLTDAEITYLRSYGHKVSKGAGVKHLDGETALAYSRIRKIDSDFRRTQRQRNVMTAALSQVRGMGVIRAIELMNKLLPQVKTNINTNSAIGFAREVFAMGGKEMEQLAIPVQGSFEDKKYKGMSVISIDFEKNADALKSFLYDNGE